MTERMGQLGRHSRGFTLVELLVSMAIFMLLMGSIMVLFLGTVRTVRQGYAMLDTMDRARAAMAALEKDVKTAFASPEKSEYFQFYGEPAGLVYVGALNDGTYGRVTYVMHADTAREPEVISLVLPWKEVFDKLVRCMEEDKNSDGVGDVTILGVDPGLIDPQTKHLTQAVYEQIKAAFVLQILGGSLPVSDDEAFDFSIEVHPGVLLRYEEKKESDLATVGSDSDQAVTTDAQNPYPAMVLDIEQAYSQAQAQGAEQVMPRDKADKMLRLEGAHRWLQRLSNGLGVHGYLPLTPSADYARWVPPFWQEDSQPFNASLPKWRDYLLVDNLLVGAWLCHPDSPNGVGGYDSARMQGVPVPALDLQTFFSYGTEDGQGGPVFNTLYNLSAVVKRPADGTVAGGASYLELLNRGANGRGVSLLAALTYFTEQQPEFGYVLGDPLTPRLPAWITPGFWIYGAAPGPGSPPTCSWFAQRVDLPSAFMRKGAG